jgi:hypothetical protein
MQDIGGSEADAEWTPGWKGGSNLFEEGGQRRGEKGKGKVYSSS